MKKMYLLMLMAFCTTALQAQTGAADSVKATVVQLFQAMQQSNAEQISAAFWPEATLQTIGRSQTGQDSLRKESLVRFAQNVGQAKVGSLDERITFGQVLVDGAIAVVWTPYSFYYNGQYSHCGVNCFQLVRQQGIWKINHLIDTRRKTNCP